jgi:hypothetical protein
MIKTFIAYDADDDNNLINERIRLDLAPTKETA